MTTETSPDPRPLRRERRRGTRRIRFADAVRAMLLMQERPWTTSELMSEFDASRDAIEHLLRSIRSAPFPLTSTRRRSEVFHSLPPDTIRIVGGAHPTS